MKKINITALITSALILIISNQSQAGDAALKAKNEAIYSCSSLAKSEARNWKVWASGQGITESDFEGLAFNMCLSGISTAINAKYSSDIDQWQIATFNQVSSLGLAPLNVNAVQKSTQIAKKYYRETRKINSSNSTRE